MAKKTVFSLIILCILLTALPLMGAQAANMHMLKQRCIDKQGIGIEAFSLLSPAGWKFSGKINWVLDNPGMPATGSLSITNPSSKAGFEMLPNKAFFWSNNPMLLQMFPMGSRYFGAEVRPVMQPGQALKEIILPGYRSTASKLKILQIKNLPELSRRLGAGQAQPGVQSFGNAAKARIAYDENGVAMEEEIIAVVEGFSFPVQTMQGVITNTCWYIDNIFAYRAPKGQLDRHASLYQTMLLSFRLNPQWFNKYNQLVNYLINAQIRQIQSLGELSRMISRTSDEISDSMMQSYQERQNAYDRISENVSESIRGTGHYRNPYEENTVELPGGYKHVWGNASGDYIFSDDAGYNPNIGSNLNWQELQQQ